MADKVINKILYKIIWGLAWLWVKFCTWAFEKKNPRPKGTVGNFGCQSCSEGSRLECPLCDKTMTV